MLDEKIKAEMLEDFKKQLLCEEKGHPFPEKIAVPYHPSCSDVLVECSGCDMLYERPPTGDELQSYVDIMKLEFTF